MKVGKVQKDVMNFVNACAAANCGAYIYARNAGLSGYDEKQVLRAIDGLVKRGIVEYGPAKLLYLKDKKINT